MYMKKNILTNLSSQMVKQEYCPTVSAFRTHKVAKQKPVPVSIYDYYDSCKFKLIKFIVTFTTIT